MICIPIVGPTQHKSIEDIAVAEPLADFLAEASGTDIDDFYSATQVASPTLAAALEKLGLLVKANLKLREKIDALEF